MAGEAERATAGTLDALRAEVARVLVGQRELVDTVLVALLCEGHVLLEGVPGLGKTELLKTLGEAITVDLGRIQFTPDLLPGDITGNPVLQEKDGARQFVFQPGSTFHQYRPCRRDQPCTATDSSGTT